MPVISVPQRFNEDELCSLLGTSRCSTTGAVLDRFSHRRARRRRSWDRFRSRAALRDVEQLAADLRRLRSLLGQDEHRSAAHQMGNRLAYDRLMIQICEMLDIEHELSGDSIGVERDIERFRVEAELERAGVVLTDRRFGQAA